MLPSGRRAVIPEIKTKRPVASIAVAWEKTPFGWRSFGLEIWVLGMARFLDRFVGKIGGDAEASSEALEHGDYARLESDAAGGTLTPAPLRLARREHLRDTGRALPGADPLGRRCGLRAEPVDIAAMRDIDGDEEMRAIVGQAQVAIERAHLRADGALRQQSAQQVDQE